MANMKQTTGALLQTLQTTAAVVTTTVNTLGKSLDMVTNTMNKYQTQQKIQHEEDLVIFLETINNSTAITLAEAAVEVDKFRSTSKSHDLYFTEYSTKLESLREKARQHLK